MTTLLSVLTVWTLLMVVSPVFRVDVRWPHARAPIETIGVLVTGVASALAYLRYSLTGARASLLVSLAFVVLSLNQLTFRLIAVPGRFGMTAQDDLYLIYVGWLAAACLLLLGSRRSQFAEKDRAHPLRDFVVGASVLIGVLASVDVVLLSFGARLPALSEAGGPAFSTASTGSLRRVSTMSVELSMLAMAAYLGAALMFRRRADEGDQGSPWLAHALVLAGFSFVQYMLLPTQFSDRISNGDLVRLAFWGVLILWQITDVRQAYFSARDRARELSIAYEQERVRLRALRALDRERAQLSRIVTHDFIHAIGALRGYAATLSNRWGDLDESLRLEVARWIDRESSRLRDLADEAVLLMQIDSEDFSIQAGPERAADLVGEAADAVDGLRGRLQVRFEAGAEGAVVAADRPRVLQVFRNLLLNAAQHSPPSTLVELEVGSGQNEVVFTVKDHGPGIAPEDVPRLFQRFSRLSTTNGQQHTGSGLGLYIARQIVEGHGGRVWVEGEPGTGAAFRFSLPRWNGAG